MCLKGNFIELDNALFLERYLQIPYATKLQVIVDLDSKSVPGFIPTVSSANGVLRKHKKNAESL